MKIRNILSALLLLCLFSCGKTTEPAKTSTNFSLECDPLIFSNSVLTVEGRDTTVIFHVDAEEGSSAWRLRCALDDNWCSYVKDGSDLRVTLAANKTKEDRETWFCVVIGDSSEKVTVHQKFVPKPPYVPTSGTSSKAVTVEIADVDFAAYPTYDILDPDGNKIGELCEEFIYFKGEKTYRERLVVAYACFEGEMNYKQGCVVSNGGTVEWGDVLIEEYVPGTLADRASVIYMNRGETCFSTEPYVKEDETVEEIAGTLRPVYVVDKRTGPENNEGQTEETYTYTVQKIGLQYWMRENLRTSRQIGGGENIATNFSTGDSGTWAKMFTTEVKPASQLVYATATQKRVIKLNVNAEDALEARNEFGLLYTWPCFTGQSVDTKNVKTDLTGPFEDSLSPEGWTVPSKLQFQNLFNYVSQESKKPADYLPYLVAKGADASIDDSFAYRDITGFGAKGGAWASAKGGHNAQTYYMTSQYEGYLASGSSPNYYGHVIAGAAFRTDKNEQFTTLSILCGLNVRLIRK